MAADCPQMESEPIQNKETIKNDIIANEIIDYLILNKEAYFKSQQRDEKELTAEEKRIIAKEVFTRSKALFLARFGKQLKENYLEYFNQYVNNENDGYDIKFYLQSLKRYFSTEKRNKDIRNRRYAALNKLIEDKNYFTETEMMKRNPLLYDQLVGQYMSEDEKKKRDNIDTENITFVNILLEGIDRDALKKKKKEQEKYEEEVMEEEEDSSDEETEKPKQKTLDSDEEIPPTERWGEFEGSEDRLQPNISWSRRPESPKKEVIIITASERKLFKEEFTSIMYQNFIDGKDSEFDYASIDDNEEFDNIEIKNCDAEEEYFDSESPEEVQIEDNKMADEDSKMEGGNNDSDDELDIFMQRLNDHHSIRELSNGMSHL